jgi:glycosyltransferase involved in cell wall biosynthesis
LKLSVLITYHNEGPWLAECLDSILPQLMADEELLIFDDASELLAEEFIPVDERVRILQSVENIGPARARNQLLAASQGTHIHFHDADDLFAVNWRAEVESAFGEDYADVVFTDAQSFDPAGKRWPMLMRVHELKLERDLLKAALRGALLAPAGTYRRELVDRVGGYREDVWQSEDYDFHIRLALTNPRWRAVDLDLVLIRRHPEQRSLKQQEVWQGALNALEHSQDRFPVAAHGDVAFAATRAGSALFAAGAPHDAARAFQLADRFGGPRYDGGIMQKLARLMGAPAAERLAAWYRKLVPEAWRARVQKRPS